MDSSPIAVTLVANFSFSRRMLTSKKNKKQSFSFSIEKFILEFLDDKYSLNLSASLGEENCKYVINVTTLEHTFEIIGTIPKSFT